MVEIKMQACVDKLNNALAFVEEYLEQQGCPMKQQIQIAVAVEEIFVNVANYAYPEGEGMVAIQIGMEEEPRQVAIIFRDSGIPYNPLLKGNPDVTLSADERDIGGLGIYLVRKSMDEVAYVYQEGENILTLKKMIS